MPFCTQITDKENCNDVSHLVTGRYKTGKSGRDFKPCFNCSDNRIDVTGSHGLLKGYENCEDKYEELDISETLETVGEFAWTESTFHAG